MAARHRKCPTPTKKKYENLVKARLALRFMPLNRSECKAYRCKDHFHLSSKPAMRFA